MAIRLCCTASYSIRVRLPQRGCHKGEQNFRDMRCQVRYSNDFTDFDGHQFPETEMFVDYCLTTAAVSFRTPPRRVIHLLETPGFVPSTHPFFVPLSRLQVRRVASGGFRDCGTVVIFVTAVGEGCGRGVGIAAGARAAGSVGSETQGEIEPFFRVRSTRNSTAGTISQTLRCAEV